MAVRIVIRSVALSCAVLLLNLSEARAGAVIVTWGETISHVGDVASEHRPLTGNAQVGFKYSYWGVFWADLWTWGGDYCLYEGQQYRIIEPDDAARLMGKSGEQLSKPFLYYVPLGWLILGPLVALGIISAVWEKRTGAVDSHYQRGLGYEAQGAHDQAIAEHNEAIRRDPNHVQAYANRGLAYLGKADYDRALTDLNMALQLDSGNASSYFSRGLVYEARNDLAKAIADFTEAIRLAPDSAATYEQRAHIYEKTGAFQQAIADYEKAIELAPSCVTACFKVATLLATSPEPACRNGKKAIVYANRAYQLVNHDANPDIAWAFQRALAAAYAEDGDFDEAIKWQKLALESAALPAEAFEKSEQQLRSYAEGRPWRERLV